jgi:hypothetical protein
MRPLKLLLIIVLLCSAVLVRAENHDLQPFEANYRIYVSKIPTPITATLTLENLPATDNYKLSLELSSLLMKNNEESFFSWNNCSPKTSFYTHQFKGFGKRRDYQMTFFWNPPQVHVTNQKQDEKIYTINDDTLDDLTLLLKARCAFKDGNNTYEATTAYGRRKRDHLLQIIGEEEIKTPMGVIKTLKIEKKRSSKSDRKTYLWIAPSLNNMLVKAKHIENRALFGEMVLRSFEFADENQLPPSMTAVDHIDAIESDIKGSARNR